MILTLFGPAAVLVGVPVAAWYAGRGFGTGAWFGGIACLLFGCLAICAIPADDPLSLHVPCPDCLLDMAGYVVWSVPWALWARWRLRRSSSHGTDHQPAAA